jgi:hypothetical protein
MLRKYEFRENRLGDNHSHVTHEVKECLPYFPHLLADLGEIRYGKPTHEAAEQLSYVKLGAVNAIHHF